MSTDDAARDTRITAFMIVKNEVKRLPSCLDSLKGCVDAVVILDTGSTDSTREYLARRAASDDQPPLVWDCAPFRGFGPTGQEALDRVKTEWALWMAADERISPELAARLQAMRRNGALARHDAWRMRRRTLVLGRQMTQRNLANERVLRLFRRAVGHISPSLVHEGLILQDGASVGDLFEPLLHDTMDSWREYMAKVGHYTTLDARRKVRPPSCLHLLTGAPVAFVRNYFGRCGFRDGWPGFVWAVTAACSVWLLDWKLLVGTISRR